MGEIVSDFVAFLENLSFNVGMTKTRTFVHKSYQNISSTVGMTKTRAFAHKSCQNCTILHYRNNISQTSPKNNQDLI
jgi:hypothetical protein